MDRRCWSAELQQTPRRRRTSLTRLSTCPGGAPRTQRPSTDLNLSVGRGQLINLSAPISDVFVANEDVADVQVRSATQIYVFAKKPGESSVFATTRSGAVVYSANVRAGTNTNSIDTMLKLAMPEAAIQSTPMNGLVLLTGTVAGPEDGAEAERLVQAFVGDDTKVVSRLRTATPLQVNLQVKIAEVSRSLVKELGVNLLNRDTTGGFLFGISQGRSFGSIGSLPTTSFPTVPASNFFPGAIGNVTINPATGLPIFGNVGTVYDFKNLGLGAGKTSIGLAGKFLGLDLASAIDLAETEGLVTTLAQPNLTALSGETASFLAGGEFPIPISQQLGSVSIEYKQYGVSLAFSPTVLADGRISMRVRPEVSELTNEGSVTLNGYTVPGITTRRAETTVELGSGQSFMIGGLMRNSQTNSIDRAPGLGNVPVLGALFRSTRYRKSETELVIIVTPYLVKPVSANQIALPTDGFKASTDAQRILLGQTHSGDSGGKRPTPTEAPPATIVAPSIGANAAPAPDKRTKTSQTAPAPGFSGN
ncbi:MAG: type II and III secretion system protein family protein [Sphingomonadales bacterium]|nr:type II and III secretion system protein family protein [Sphingomonadales bacterium]